MCEYSSNRNDSELHISSVSSVHHDALTSGSKGKPRSLHIFSTPSVLLECIKGFPFKYLFNNYISEACILIETTLKIDYSLAFTLLKDKYCYVLLYYLAWLHAIHRYIPKDWTFVRICKYTVSKQYALNWYTLVNAGWLWLKWNGHLVPVINNVYVQALL